MKMISVFNANGDEIRVPSDMVEYYATIGWVPVQESDEEEVEEFE